MTTTPHQFTPEELDRLTFEIATRIQEQRLMQLDVATLIVKHIDVQDDRGRTRISLHADNEETPFTSLLIKDKAGNSLIDIGLADSDSGAAEFPVIALLDPHAQARAELALDPKTGDARLTALGASGRIEAEAMMQHGQLLVRKPDDAPAASGAAEAVPEVRAQRFVLVGPDGKECGSWTPAQEGGAVLGMHTPNGTAGVQLLASGYKGGTAGLTLTGENALTLMDLQTSIKDGANINLYDDDGALRVSASAHDEYASVTVMDRAGPDFVEMAGVELRATNGQQPAVSIFDDRSESDPVDLAASALLQSGTRFKLLDAQLVVVHRTDIERPMMLRSWLEPEMDAPPELWINLQTHGARLSDYVRRATEGQAPTRPSDVQAAQIASLQTQLQELQREVLRLVAKGDPGAEAVVESLIESDAEERRERSRAAETPAVDLGGPVADLAGKAKPRRQRGSRAAARG